MKIRKAKIEDLKEIQRLHSDLIIFERDKYVPTLKKNKPYSKEGISYLRKSINNKDCHVLVCEDKGNLVGLLIGSFEGKDQGRGIVLAELHPFFLEEKYRGEGIGTKMFKQFKKWAKKKGADTIELGVYFNNKKSIELYEELNFTKYGIIMIEKI